MVLLAIAVLSTSVGQENVVLYCNGESVNEHALPIFVNDSDLQLALNEYPFFVLEGFASWCGNCKEMNVTLSKLSTDLKGQIAFGLINSERNNETARKYNITAYPTLMIFKHGTLVDTHTGYMSVPEFVEALKRLEPGLDISHVNITAGEWFKEGFALYSKGKYNDSIEAYSKALELDPKNVSIWNNYGLGLYSLSRYDDATKAYDKAIEIDSSYADAWNNRGAAFAVQGKYNEALEAFDRAIEINPANAKAWNNKGKALKQLHRDVDADAAFAKANELW